MPLHDITRNEVNIPHSIPFKRQHSTQHLDDDNTFLPPALSSFGRDLLGESKHQSDIPVTGIYEFDFPDKNQALRNKLSVHFNEQRNTNTHTNTNKNNNINNKNNSHNSHNSHNNINNSTNNNNDKNIRISDHEKLPVFQDEYNEKQSSLSNSYNTANNFTNNTANNSHSHILEPSFNRISSANVDYLSNPNSIHSNNSYRSLATVATTPGAEDFVTNSNSISTGSGSQIHSIKKMRGSRRFGKLGPPKRGTILTEEQNAAETPPLSNCEQDKDILRSIDNISEKKNVSISNVKDIESKEKFNQNNFETNLNKNEFGYAENRKFDAEIDKQKEIEQLCKQKESNSSPNYKIEYGQNNQLKSYFSSKVDDIDPIKYMENHQNSNSLKNESIKRKKLITINEVQYEKLELLGRGGSSKVYKVKALSNNKIYAIKKVTFDSFDESCVQGFKGEIDLLMKLKDRDRVVRLIDHAVGEGSIYLVMECGDTDLAHVFQSKLSQGQKLDIDFVRFHAIEIFKCVLEVHKAGIVHSDLKPANFLFVRGILKIIDFGIANAVPDHTANIYRESQIGTPNYMAPEALVEINQVIPNTADRGLKNTWKVGKPSDVWSCGCIIYQMIYGKPPYGSYSGNQRIMAIMNPQVRINYPDVGLGGVRVPKSAIDLMKKCFSRNPNERYSVEECLNSDFLHPKIVNEDFIRDLVHSAVNFGINNRAGGSGLITADIYDKLVETVLSQIEDLHYG